MSLLLIYFSLNLANCQKKLPSCQLKIIYYNKINNKSYSPRSRTRAGGDANNSITKQYEQLLLP